MVDQLKLNQVHERTAVHSGNTPDSGVIAMRTRAESP